VIVAEPTATPVTTPVEEPTVAVPVALLDQVPPVAVSASVVVKPTATEVVPVMAGTTGGVFTVKPYVVVVEPQELVTVYVIVAAPTPTPVTMPEDEPTDAIAVLLLLQVPPVVASLSVTVAVVHTLFRPVIVPAVAGTVLTVIG
jgi:hypothetical protein